MLSNNPPDNKRNQPKVLTLEAGWYFCMLIKWLSVSPLQHSAIPSLDTENHKVVEARMGDMEEGKDTKPPFLACKKRANWY